MNEASAAPTNKEWERAVGELSFFGGYGAEPICAAPLHFNQSSLISITAPLLYSINY